MNAALPMIGSDPEFFVSNSSGEIDSAIGFIGGTKENPRPVNGGALQEDNVLVELNTTPTTDPSEFNHNLTLVLGQADEILNPQGRYVSLFRRHYTYPTKKLMGWGEPAMRFGCDPDYNVYTGLPNQIASGFTRFRSAGGHLHIGWNHLSEVTREDQDAVAKMADFVLGLWGVVNGDSVERRQLYGKAGCVRYKPYGIEYRTLGNFWVSSSLMRIEAFRRAQLSYIRRDVLPILESIGGSDIQEIINTCDVDRALELLSIVDGVLDEYA